METRLPKSRTAMSLIILFLIVAFGVVPLYAFPSLGFPQDIVAATAEPGAFALVQNGHAAPLFLDQSDYAGVLRAASDLQCDIERVTGTRPELIKNRSPKGKFVVIAGTLGKSSLIDKLAKLHKINATPIAGKWESFIITTVKHPFPGVDQALVIAGSDKRGTIYGEYEISEQIGVSPWYWWADVPAQHHDALLIKLGTYVQGPPAVKYRGIFINDENPCLFGWAKEKFGGVNSKMYVHMFELILRLRGNYLWPAMWGKAFNEDDPVDPRLADEYGVVMGTSHHEPMMRAQEEWTKHHAEYGNGEWNYRANSEGLKKFWAAGIDRNKNYENIITVGMRGDGDLPMPDAGGFGANKKLLERIITDQRQIIAEHVNPDPSKVPQVWTLFTEVQKYYDTGLRVPDDVTLLFADDNIGDLRRVPTAEERNRSGGSGIYFHMDMHGGPYSYQWLNTNPLPRIWEQMNLAYRYGATRIWIANVGDLKPLEIPIEFFLRMAWDPAAMTKDKIADYQLRWAERDFGKEHAAEIADLVAKYAKYNGWRKPDILKPETFTLIHYREAERVSAAWSDLAARAEKLNAELPQDQRDAFYELVLHPVEACANLNQMYIAAARNHFFAEQGRASANAEADRVRELFRKDKALSDYYNHQLAGGKWDHMMDQTHLGYVAWYPPPQDVMPAVSELIVPDSADLGVAVEGAPMSWPNYYLPPELPTFDSISKRRSYIEVFPVGSRPTQFTFSADKPWIHMAETKAFSSSTNDRRIWVDIDWANAPVGESTGTVTIKGTPTVDVMVRAIRASDEQAREAAGAFGGLVGPIAIAAQEATRNVSTAGVQWERIPDYGRSAAAMEVFPVTAQSIQPPNPAPRLEYPLYLAKAGKYDVDVVTAPTLDFYPGLALALGVSMDDHAPQVVKVFTPETQRDETFLGRNFYQNASNNARTMHFTQTVDSPGKHTLKITMVDPAVVVQKIIIYQGSLPYSYFGPPPSTPNGDSRRCEDHEDVCGW